MADETVLSDAARVFQSLKDDWCPEDQQQAHAVPQPEFFFS